MGDSPGRQETYGMPQARLRTLTLGCKVNQYETEYVRQGLVDAGRFRDAQPGEPADLCLVNTCTVTQEGGREESPGDSPTGPAEPRSPPDRDGLLCHASSPRNSPLCQASSRS